MTHRYTRIGLTMEHADRVL